MKTNPLLANTPLPLYDQINGNHVKDGMQYVLSELQGHILEMENNSNINWEDIKYYLSIIERKTLSTWGVVKHLVSVKNNEELYMAYKKILPKMTEFETILNQNNIIYKALIKIKNSDKWNDLSKVDKYIVAVKLREMLLSGVLLEKHKK